MEKEQQGNKTTFTVKQRNIFLSFFRVGILGYGGGPSSIPLVHKEVVEKYRWMNDNEFSDVLALANTLPGPIATKMAGYIGYKIAGTVGMLNAVLATIVPTIFFMIILLTSLANFKEYSWVAGMTKAVIPVVAIMLAVLTWDFIKKSNTGLGAKWSIILIGVSLLLIQFLHVHPGFVIVVLLGYALLKKETPSEKATRQKEGGQ